MKRHRSVAADQFALSVMKTTSTASAWCRTPWKRQYDGHQQARIDRPALPCVPEFKVLLQCHLLLRRFIRECASDIA